MITRRERYAAKMCYQLCLMTGKSKSRQLDYDCHVDYDNHVVVVKGLVTVAVPIAKAWVEL